MRHISARFILGAVLFTCFQPAIAQNPKPKIIFQDYDIDHRVNGSAFTPVLKDIRSPEFRSAATLVASQFDIPPEGIDAAIDLIPEQNGSEDHSGFFRPQIDGYTTCRFELLKYDHRAQRGHDVTFNVSTRRSCYPDADGVAYYAVVPRTNGETYVRARLRIVFALADPATVKQWTKDGKCMPHGTLAVECRNGDCKTPRSIANTPEAPGVDRWLNDQLGPCR